jgi:hypothetical protein
MFFLTIAEARLHSVTWIPCIDQSPDCERRSPEGPADPFAKENRPRGGGEHSCVDALSAWIEPVSVPA